MLIFRVASYNFKTSQQTRNVFSPVWHVVFFVENWCKEYSRVLSVFLLVFTEKHILVIFNIHIIFFILSILDITNYLCLGDINVL